MSTNVSLTPNTLERNAFAGHAKCKGKSRRTGLPCGQIAMENGFCRLHGGKNPKGIAHGNFKHGRYSKYLKDITLASAYEAAANDPELLNLSEEITLLRARLSQLVEKIDVEDSVGRWKAARVSFERYKEAAARQDEYGWRKALAELDDALRQGGKDGLVWDDILKTLKHYADLITKEQKRRMDMNALISVDQAVGFAAELLYAVKENVHDQQALRAIHDKVSDALTKRPHFSVALQQQQQGDGV